MRGEMKQVALMKHLVWVQNLVFHGKESVLHPSAVIGIDNRLIPVVTGMPFSCVDQRVDRKLLARGFIGVYVAKNKASMIDRDIKIIFTDVIKASSYERLDEANKQAYVTLAKAGEL